MAGASMGDDEENPCAVNVVPLIDVIFCLCVFFFCVFQFKATEGKIDAWLPKEHGQQPRRPEFPPPYAVRVTLKWDSTAKRCIRSFDGETTDYANDTALAEAICRKYEKAKQFDKNAVVKIDDISNPRKSAPWQEVVTVMDLCKGKGIDALEFAHPVAAK